MRDTSSNSNTGYCVTCLKCGKIHQKGYAADAVFICPKCGYENYVYLSHGVEIVMPAAHMQNQQFLIRIRKFALGLERLLSDKEVNTLPEETKQQ